MKILKKLTMSKEKNDKSKNKAKDKPKAKSQNYLIGCPNCGADWEDVIGCSNCGLHERDWFTP